MQVIYFKIKKVQP